MVRRFYWLLWVLTYNYGPRRLWGLRWLNRAVHHWAVRRAKRRYRESRRLVSLR